jgi:phage gp46-like protein
MTDIALRYSEENQYFDIAIGANGDLVQEDGFETAIALSLYLDRRAELDDEIPDGTDDRRGDWADVFSDIPGDKQGSRLWLLSRAKEEPDTLLRAKEYAEEALAWMLNPDDVVARSVSVTATHVAPGVLGLLIDIARPNGERYQKQWKYHLEGTA